MQQDKSVLVNVSNDTNIYYYRLIIYLRIENIFRVSIQLIIETRFDVFENEKLKWEQESEWCFHSNSSFPKLSRVFS